MQLLKIRGGRRLSGEITIQGAKNSVLPLLSACVLTGSAVRLTRCPELSDVYSALRILSSLGCKCRLSDGCADIDSRTLSGCEIGDKLMRQMRSSIIFMGALLGACGECVMSFPGGCELGPRPIDMHISALRQLGAEITDEHGKLICRCPHGLRGTVINLPFPSVGATENILLAAVCAEGETVIVNAAREPEITELCGFLTLCGAKIRGAGCHRIVVEGVERSELHGCEFEVMPDRIAAATYLCAAAASGGEAHIKGARSGDLEAVINVLGQSGCQIAKSGSGIYICAPPRLKCVNTVRTCPYPGFPTDAQAVVMAAFARSKGMGIFVEDIFENRFRHVDELVRMGADIKTEGRVAIVRGVERLTGAQVSAPDLRGGAALCVAACAAEGETTVSNICYIDRGYDSIEKALGSLGADITRL